MGTRLAPEIRGYRILREIGQGGMGAVYLATPIAEPHRQVAIKVLLPGVLVREKEVVRFGREGKVAQSLEHPHLLPVLEFGECDGNPYLVMEYVEGTTLQQRIWAKKERAARGPALSASEAETELVEDLRIIAQIARALDCAHRHGLVHRDIKPGNILIRSDGHPFLIDFGLARALDDGSSLTSSGVVLGTPWYMAPEQLIGDTKRIGPASDVYALGVTLYETVSGRRPFDAHSFEEQRARVLDEEPLPLRTRAPAVEIEPIVLKALEKVPEHRYPTAGEMAQDIERVIAGMEPLARQIVLHLRRALRRIGRQQVRATAAAAVVLACAVVWLWRTNEARAEQALDLKLANLFLAAESALEQSDSTRAFSYFQSAIDLKPDQREGYLRRATAYVRLDQFRKAAEDIQHAEERGFSLAESENARDIFLQGLYWQAKRNRILAADMFEKAIQQDPYLYTAYFALYQVEMALDRPESARRHLEVFRQDLKRHDPSYDLVQADLLDMEGKHEESAALLLGLRDKQSGPNDALSARISRNLGRVYARLGKYDLAQAELRAALAFDVTDVAARINLGITLLEEQQRLNAGKHASAPREPVRLVEALECARQALAIDGTAMRAYELLGQSAFLLGREHEALSFIDEGLRHAAESRALRGLRSWITFQQAQRLGELEDYAGEYRKLLETLAATENHFGALVQLSYNLWSGTGNGPEETPKDPASAFEAVCAAREAWVDLTSRKNDPDFRWQATYLGHRQHFMLCVAWFGLACEMGHLDEASLAKSAALLDLQVAAEVNPRDIVNLIDVLAVRAPAGLRDCAGSLELICRFELREFARTDPQVGPVLDQIEAACKSDHAR